SIAPLVKNAPSRASRQARIVVQMQIPNTPDPRSAVVFVGFPTWLAEGCRVGKSLKGKQNPGWHKTGVCTGNSGSKDLAMPVAPAAPA
ncbi:MAG TPA: hypothetical protein VF229_00170, partial [Burkholderiaceae bacterium]